MPKATINVVNGAIQVSPDTLKVNRRTGEAAEWQCNDGRFQIQFKGKTPFQQGNYGGPKGSSKSTGPCKKDAALGLYAYGVTVWIDENNPIVLDPGVEVWDDGGNG